MMSMSVKIDGSIALPNGQTTAGAIRRGMLRIAHTVAGQAAENDGRPGPIRRSGLLHSSIAGVVSADGMSAVVGTPVEYAPRIELGYSGPETVKAHTRTISQAFGRPIAPRKVDVASFTRQANARPYPFLRPAIDYAQRIHMFEDILTDEIVKAAQ